MKAYQITYNIFYLSLIIDFLTEHFIPVNEAKSYFIVNALFTNGNRKQQSQQLFGQ